MAGLSAEQAAWIAGPGFNSIWQIVLHMSFWQEFALNVLQDQAFDRHGLGGENGWYPIADPTDQAAWQAACARLLEGNAALASWTASLDDAFLIRSRGEGRAKAWQVLQGIIAHNAYHTSELITLRHQQGLWLEDV
ncbi:MAG TPA: DinB family protein [Anaerolineaceae bacterium]|nr:DinB family protein [Anaerolineaceae bacterium]